MSELKRTGLWGRVNVIITSDHGMAQCSAERLIRLDDCLHPDNYTAVELTPVAAIMPHGGERVCVCRHWHETMGRSNCTQRWKSLLDVYICACLLQSQKSYMLSWTSATLTWLRIWKRTSLMGCTTRTTSSSRRSYWLLTRAGPSSNVGTSQNSVQLFYNGYHTKLWYNSS